jgi:REP element-mobilizing transposase RayT
MRQRRIVLRGEAAVYHCMSRTVSGTRLFDPHAKEVLRKMLWDAAAFSGIEVLAYCIMTNHFHVLVRVPEKVGEVTDMELLRRYQTLYAHDPSPGYPSTLELKRILAEGGEPARLWRARLRQRMGDLSEFMKTLKQRFSVWYNRNHDRYGPLWSDRFLSVLVEDEPRMLRTVAAYIDLNPVRAHLASDPADYRWCSYAEAVGGHPEAQAAYREVLGEGESRRPWQYLGEYRAALFRSGRTPRRVGDGVTDEARSDWIEASGGRFAWHELVHYRVLHLTRGRALGTVSFVARAMKQILPADPRPPIERRFSEVPLSEDGESLLVTGCRPRRPKSLSEWCNRDSPA